MEVVADVLSSSSIVADNETSLMVEVVVHLLLDILVVAVSCCLLDGTTVFRVGCHRSGLVVSEERCLQEDDCEDSMNRVVGIFFNGIDVGSTEAKGFSP